MVDKKKRFLVPIYESVRIALVARGWDVDYDAKPDKLGVVREFVDPTTHARVSWLEALVMQQEKEEVR